MPSLYGACNGSAGLGLGLGASFPLHQSTSYGHLNDVYSSVQPQSQSQPLFQQQSTPKTQSESKTPAQAYKDTGIFGSHGQSVYNSVSSLNISAMAQQTPDSSFMTIWQYIFSVMCAICDSTKDVTHALKLIEGRIPCFCIPIFIISLSSSVSVF